MKKKQNLVSNLVIFATFFILSTHVFADQIKSVRVIDEQGNKIKSFQCMVRHKRIGETSFSRWREIKTETGIVNINITELKEASIHSYRGKTSANGLEILVQADEYGPELLRCKFEQIPDEIKIDKPVKVVLVKLNKSVAGKPVIVLSECIDELRSSFVGYPLKLKKINADKWECNLKKGQEYVIGWQTEKGWFSKELKEYSSKPFIALNDGQVINFDPGMPVTVKYDLSKVPKFLNLQKYPVSIELCTIGPDGKIQYAIDSVEIKKTGIAQIPNIAAGVYYLKAYSHTGNSSIPCIYDQRQITVESGKQCRIEPVYPVLDTTIEPNDVAIKGVVLDVEKNPIANKKVSLWMQKFDENRILVTSDIFYNPVKTNSKGKFEFKGVLPGRYIQLECQGESIPLARGSFSGNKEVNVSFVVGQKEKTIAVGKPFAFPIVRLENNSQKNLNEFKGKIIVMDIWASWCGYCVRSMPKLNEDANQIQSENIKFITLSLDNDKQAWKNKLAENSWRSLLHTRFDNTINNHKLKFKGGIPFCVIIDRQGIVRAAGNEVDIKKELQKLTDKTRF
jgi:thiol-disulfide isomerase/thioredoxin